MNEVAMSTEHKQPDNMTGALEGDVIDDHEMTVSPGKSAPSDDHSLPALHEDEPSIASRSVTAMMNVDLDVHVLIKSSGDFIVQLGSCVGVHANRYV